MCGSASYKQQQQNNSNSHPKREKDLLTPEMIKGERVRQPPSPPSARKAKDQLWLGEEFPHITISNNNQLTIIGCRRQWWIVYQKPIEHNPNGHFLPGGIHSQNWNRRKIPLEGFAHWFSCFPDMVINKKKCRCSDSPLHHMTMFYPLLGCSYCSFYVVVALFFNFPAHAVLRNFSVSQPCVSLLRITGGVHH